MNMGKGVSLNKSNKENIIKRVGSNVIVKKKDARQMTSTVNLALKKLVVANFPTMESSDPKQRIAEARRKYSELNRPARVPLRTSLCANANVIVKICSPGTKLPSTELRCRERETCGAQEQNVPPSDGLEGASSSDDFEICPTALSSILSNEGIKPKGFVNANLGGGRSSMFGFRAASQRRASLFPDGINRLTLNDPDAVRSSLAAEKCRLLKEQQQSETVVKIPGSILKKSNAPLSFSALRSANSISLMNSAVKINDMFSTKKRQPTADGRGVKFADDVKSSEDTRRCLAFEQTADDDDPSASSSHSSSPIPANSSANTVELDRQKECELTVGGEKSDLKPFKSRSSGDVRDFLDALSPCTLGRFVRVIVNEHSKQLTTEAKEEANESAIDSPVALPISKLPFDRLSVIPEFSPTNSSPYMSALKKSPSVHVSVATPKIEQKPGRRSAFSCVAQDASRVAALAVCADQSLNNMTLLNDQSADDSTVFCLPSYNPAAPECDGENADDTMVLEVKTPRAVRPAHMPPGPESMTPPMLLDHDMHQLKPPMRTPLFLRNHCVGQRTVQPAPTQGTPKDTAAIEESACMSKVDFSTIVFGGVANSTVIDESSVVAAREPVTRKSASLPPLDLSPIALAGDNGAQFVKPKNKGKSKNGAKRSIVADALLCDQEVMLINERPKRAKGTSRPVNPLSSVLEGGDNTLFIPITPSAAD